MKVLLDTNIVIERENPRKANPEVNMLFAVLDKLKVEKYIHPSTKLELNNHLDKNIREIMEAKLLSYNQIIVVPKLPIDFMNKLKPIPDLSSNDAIDSEMLFQVFDQRIDVLITQDRKIHKRAELLGISDGVFSIETFMQYYYRSYPDLVKYKVLAVNQIYFANLDINDQFFDSLREAYSGFDRWYKSKSNERAYAYIDDEFGLQGFLYLKTEGIKENYSRIIPPMEPKKRLKIGTFKVISSGFRLGERFLKIIFDNALANQVDEIYVTLFDTEELQPLLGLLIRYGFIRFGQTENGELVLTKNMKSFDPQKTPVQNFPLYNKDATKKFLPIYPVFHTELFPDSILNNEAIEKYSDNRSYRYALQKSYITWADIKGCKSGDIIAIYRTGGSYNGVISTICIVDEIIVPMTKEDLFNACQNRSIFSSEQLRDFWSKSAGKIKVIKLLMLKNLNKRVLINTLWSHGIIEEGSGPRPFDEISNSDFEKILSLSETQI